MSLGKSHREKNPVCLRKIIHFQLGTQSEGESNQGCLLEQCWLFTSFLQSRGWLVGMLRFALVFFLPVTLDHLTVNIIIPHMLSSVNFPNLCLHVHIMWKRLELDSQIGLWESIYHYNPLSESSALTSKGRPAAQTNKSKNINIQKTFISLSYN